MSSYADLTNLTEILKNVYGEGLKNQFNDEKITYNQFPKSDRAPGGKGYVFGIRNARAQGTGGRAESAALPPPLTGIKDQGTINPRYNYGSIRITGPAIEAAKGDQAAFVDGLADEIDDIYQSIIVDLNRQCHWDGFGKIATLSVASSYSGTTTWAGTFNNDLGVTYFQEGMLIDMYDASGASIQMQGATAAVGCRVKAITPSTKVVIFEEPHAAYHVSHPYLPGSLNAAGVTLPVSALAIKSGARNYTGWASTDTPSEITGILGIYDSTTYLAAFEGITVATNPNWAANIISNSSVNRELSIDLMINACDLTRMRSGKKVDIIRMGMGQRRKYANLLLPDVRFAPTVLKGGYETLTFSGGDGSIEMLIDPVFQPNMITFEPRDVVKKYELTPLGWGNLDGSQLHQRAGYDEWDAYLRIYTNLGAEQRNCLTVIRDLTEPTYY